MPLSARFLILSLLLAGCQPAGMSPAPGVALGVAGSAAPAVAGTETSAPTGVGPSGAPAVNGPAAGTVGGTAAFRGAPLADALVEVFAAGRVGPVASARTDAAGAFRVPLTGVPADQLLRVVATGERATLAGMALVSTGGGNIVSAGGSNIVSAGGSNIVSAGGSNYALAAALDGLALGEAGTLAYLALAPRLLPLLGAPRLTPAQAAEVAGAFDALRGALDQAPAGAFDGIDLQAAMAQGAVPDAAARALVAAVPGFSAAFLDAARRLGDVLAAAMPDRRPPDLRFGGLDGGRYDAGGSRGSGGGSPESTSTPPAIVGRIR